MKVGLIRVSFMPSVTSWSVSGAGRGVASVGDDPAAAPQRERPSLTCVVHFERASEIEPEWMAASAGQITVVVDVRSAG